MFDPELVFTELRNKSGLLLRVTIRVNSGLYPRFSSRSASTVCDDCNGPGGCGGGSSGVPAAASVPQFQHVVLVVEENHSFSSVIGNSAMPYLNGLASQYSLATQYYADTHPSIGNYFMLTTGQVSH